MARLGKGPGHWLIAQSVQCQCAMGRLSPCCCVQVATRDDTHVLIIADDRGDQERHRDRFATYQTEGTPGVYMHTTLDTLLDTVHFAPSHRSRMLQAADMLAFIHRRFLTVTESDPRAAENMRRLWIKVVGERLFNQGSWP